MPSKRDCKVDANAFREQLHQDGQELGELLGWIFLGSVIYVDLCSLAERNSLEIRGKSKDNAESFDLRLELAANKVRFAGGKIKEDLQNGEITHIVIGDDNSRLKGIREQLKWYAVYSSISVRHI
jgi:hypothetical protein